MDIIWIRDKLKHFSVMLKNNEPAFITLEMIDEYVENQNVQINTLQSDLDEAQKALEDVMDVNDKLRAGLLGMAKMILSDDITEIEISNMELKAEKIIKELENEYNDKKNSKYT